MADRPEEPMVKAETAETTTRVFQGRSWGILWEFYGNLWEFMGIYGNLWDLDGFNGIIMGIFNTFNGSMGCSCTFFRSNMTVG